MTTGALDLMADCLSETPEHFRENVHNGEGPEGPPEHKTVSGIALVHRAYNSDELPRLKTQDESCNHESTILADIRQMSEV